MVAAKDRTLPVVIIRITARCVWTTRGRPIATMIGMHALTSECPDPGRVSSPRFITPA